MKKNSIFRKWWFWILIAIIVFIIIKSGNINLSNFFASSSNIPSAGSFGGGGRIT